MKKIIILASCLFYIGNIYSQWNTYYTGEYTQHFDIFFINQNTGWTAGDGSKVFKTTNCGLNWNQIFSSTSDDIYCMYFIDSNKAWAAGFTGNVLKTTNGGYNWSSAFAVYNKNIRDIFFINENTGWCVGEDGTLRKTTNGGNNWFNPSTNFYQYNASSIYFVNSLTGFSGGVYNLAKTTDGGSNWISYSNSQLYFGDIYFINSNTGWVFCGLIGNSIGLYVMKTTNCGVNWNVISSDTASNGYYIGVKDSYFLNENLGYIVGVAGYMGPSPSLSGFMEKTTNGGANWNNVYYYWGGNVEAITFVNQQTGFACGSGGFSNGTVYKTTNGGISFTGNISNEIPDKFLLYQNYPNPFNPVTNIKFQIANNKYVTLKVFDILGKEVATLVNENLKPGEYEVTFEGKDLPSGIYFYSLHADGKWIDSKKMIILK
jgi:photosystem II stability/assembly factor-like uncharacterized protein